MAKAVDISIIIVSFNTKDFTVNCVESVLAHLKNLQAEIIIVDNASTDGSVSALKKVKAKGGVHIRVIKNSKNMGFAQGNNIGAKWATGKYILFLNSDTKVTSDVFSKAVSWLDDHEKVALYSCGLRNKDGSFQEAGGYFPTLGRVALWMLFVDDIPGLSGISSSYHPKPSFYKTSHYVDWVKGTAMFARRTFWEDLGGFDRDYFMYVEDVDICFRAKGVGWKVYYSADPAIIHYGGASSNVSYPIISEYKGLRIFFAKHKPRWQGMLLRAILKMGAILRILVFGAIKPGVIGTYKNAYKVA